MWFDESVIYQIYPLGFCGAPKENDGIVVSRINKVISWLPHIKNLGANAIYFSPVFNSDKHGYDTRDYKIIDPRLGTNDDFKIVTQKLHENNIKIILDGVFNHVGRGFWAFKDVIENKYNSAYKDWFHINFDGNSNYNDGFWYEGWEGHFELAKLNLYNPDVINYLFSCIDYWVEEFDIDGLRLDVAYCLPQEFLKQLRSHCDGLKEDFLLLGELLHGDYNMFVSNDKLNSCTNYECYKGLYSSFNSNNMFEITHSLIRQFGSDPWCLYTGKNLMCFVDNHDVTRIASMLNNENHLPLIYGLLFAMPGVPCVYYGSEWGVKGLKENGDDALRECYDTPIFNNLSEFISKLSDIHKNSKALCYGSFRSVHLTNKQVIFERKYENERILVAINSDSSPYTAHFDAGCGRAIDLITQNPHDFGGGTELKPYSVAYFKTER